MVIKKTNVSFALLRPRQHAQKQHAWSMLWPQKVRHCSSWRSLLLKALTHRNRMHHETEVDGNSNKGSGERGIQENL